jgi:hypothetical protein
MVPPLALVVELSTWWNCFEHALLLFQGYSGARVGDTDSEVTIHGFGSDTDLTGVGELDGVADEVE